MAPQKKNLMENYEDGNLDLSLSGIQDVPVRDIAAITKAINLDLSCNTISTLPKSFASSLTRLVKLDLSKNQLTCLPENFGLLVNLKHLDLYSNKLESLPLSCGNLRALRWLDVKENPLMPRLAEIAGMCLDAQQCQLAARKVVAALRATQDSVNEEISRLKEEQSKKAAEEEEISKAQNKENKPKKKKKKAASSMESEISSKLANGKTQLNDDEELGKDLEENALKSKTMTKTKSGNNPGIFGKVGRVLKTLITFVVMSSLLVVCCGFILSLIDEDMYMSARKKIVDFIQLNVPKPYMKRWNNGMLVTQRTVENWTTQTIELSVHCYNKLHDYFVTISSNEVVDQYLESIKSWWHIFWIWVSESYISMSVKVPQHFDSLRQLIFSSRENKS